jgi:hypothetical protein
VDFLASPFQLQENEKAQKMNAICGKKCLEQFAKFNRAGLWAKTFSELLIGRMDWYSSKSSLIWKLKGTKYKRMYFQLVAKTHLTKERESGLLPTVAAMDANGIKQLRKDSNVLQGGRHSVSLTHLMALGFLPTSTAGDGMRGQNGNTTKIVNGRFVRISNTTGTQYGASLEMAAATGLLPTPTVQASRGNASHNRMKGNLTDKIAEMQLTSGKTSQLNPQFVLEMMGFPTDWTLLPFQNGEQKVSKELETQ